MSIKIFRMPEGLLHRGEILVLSGKSLSYSTGLPHTYNWPSSEMPTSRSTPSGIWRSGEYINTSPIDLTSDFILKSELTTSVYHVSLLIPRNSQGSFSASSSDFALIEYMDFPLESSQFLLKYWEIALLNLNNLGVSMDLVSILLSICPSLSTTAVISSETNATFSFPSNFLNLTPLLFLTYFSFPLSPGLRGTILNEYGDCIPLIRVFIL